MKTSLNRSIRIARALFPVLLVLAAVGLAAAEEDEGRQSRRGDRGGVAERGADRIARVLELTDDQRQEWRRLHEQHAANVRPLMEQMRDVTERLEAEADLENPDPTVVGQLELDRRGLGRQMREARAQLDEDLVRLLDHDQRIRWETLRESGRRGSRRPFGPSRRGPRSRS